MIPFTKAHACGNDFLIVTEDDAGGYNWVELTRRLCMRTTGIGADGVEFFAWTGPQSGRIRLHNADGSIAEISGNGTRCVAAWMAHIIRSQPGDLIEISTDAGLRICQINALTASAGFTVEVTTGMGIPAYQPHTVTIKSRSAYSSAAWDQPLLRVQAVPPRPLRRARLWDAVHHLWLWHREACRLFIGRTRAPS